MKRGETHQIVTWLEKKILFIKKYHTYITEVNVYNETVENFGKKYYRIYIDITINPVHLIKQFNELTEFEHEMKFHMILPKYYYFPALGQDENEVKLHYEWVAGSCAIRLLGPPFKLSISNYD
jgi:hypothetical protein